MGIHKGRGSISALLITACLLSTGHGYYQSQSGPPQPRYIPASSGGGGAGGGGSQPSYRYNPPPQENYNTIPAGGYNEPYRPPAKRGYPSSVPQQYYSSSSGAYSGGYQSNQPGYQGQPGYPPPPPGQPGYPPNPPPAQPGYQPSYPPGQQPYQAPVDYPASNGYPPAPAAQAPPPAYPPSNQYPPPPAYDRGYGGTPGYQGGYNGQQPYNGYYEVAPSAYEVVPPRQPGAYTPQMVATTSTTTTTTTTAVPTTTVMAELEPQEFEGVTTLAPTTTTTPTTTPTTTLPPTPAPQYRPYPGQYGPSGPPGQYGNGPPPLPQGPQQPWDRQGPAPYNPNPGYAQPGYPPAGAPAYGTSYQQQAYPNPYGYPQQQRAPQQAVGYRPAPQQQPAAAPYRPPPQSQAVPYRSPPANYGPPKAAPVSYGTPAQAPATAGNYRPAAPAPPRAPAPAPTPIRSYGGPPAVRPSENRPSYQVTYGAPQTYRQTASPNYRPTPAASLANSRPQYNTALPPQNTQYRPRPPYSQSQSAQPYNPAPAPAPYSRPASAQPYRQPPAQSQYGRAPAPYGRAPAASNPYRPPPPSAPSSNYRPQSSPPYQAATSNPYNRPPSQPRPYTRYNRSPTVPAPKPQPEKKTSIAQLTQQLSKAQTPQPKEATPGPTRVIKTSPSLPRRPPGAPVPKTNPLGSQVTFISPQNLRFPTPVPFPQTSQPQRVEVGRIVQSSSQSHRNKFFRGRRSVKTFPMVEQTSIPQPIMEQPTIVQPLFGRPAILRPKIDSQIMDPSSDVLSNPGHYIQDTPAETYTKIGGSSKPELLAPITPETGIMSRQHDLIHQVSLPRDAWLNQASRSLSDLLNETPRIQDLALAESMPNNQQETRGQNTPLFNSFTETPVTVPQLKGFGAFYHSFVDDFRTFGKRGIHMSTGFPGA